MSSVTDWLEVLAAVFVVEVLVFLMVVVIVALLGAC